MTPVISSWIKGMEQDQESVTMILASGKRIRYTGVPETVLRAIQTAHSPGKVWRELVRGKYGERWL